MRSFIQHGGQSLSLHAGGDGKKTKADGMASFSAEQTNPESQYVHVISACLFHSLNPC